MKNKKTAVFRPLFRALSVALFAGAAGCAPYRLGSTLPPEIRSVHVPTFVNRTTEPLIEVEATRAVIREFQQDGTLKVVSADNADAVLAGTLVRYTLEPVRYETDRTKVPDEYRLKIFTDISLQRSLAGDPLWTKRVEGESTFTSTGNIATEKQEALPAAAADLAHDIVESVVEFW